MKITQLTPDIIKRDFCPHCLHYIDKHIYRDCDSSVTIIVGTVKDCKFHIDDTSWVCRFEEVLK